MAFQTLNAFCTAQVIGQVGDIHGAHSITTAAASAVAVVGNQAQGSDFIEYCQGSPKRTKVFAPEEPVYHGGDDKYYQDTN